MQTHIRLAALLVALATAGTAHAQTYTGVWDVGPVTYDSGGSGACPNFSFSGLTVTDTYPTASVYAHGGAMGTLSGNFSAANTLNVTAFTSVPLCGLVTYTMTLTFSGTTLSGTLKANIPGFPCSCNEPLVPFSGSLNNSGENYCTAGASANGCLASVYTTGIASATQSSGFEARATQVEGAKSGLFFFGANGRQASPWGSGTSYQCVVPPVMRAGLQTATGTPGMCHGQIIQDLNARWCPSCPKPGQNPGAGAVVQIQLWYRDPLNTSNQSTSLSRAREFTVWP
jgi:hypothetical protein